MKSSACALAQTFHVEIELPILTELKSSELGQSLNIKKSGLKYLFFLFSSIFHQNGSKKSNFCPVFAYSE